ncbi:hypothetical protein SKAU_G00429860 [Synaphobranchus kaupii]|uniref:Uncharacterized protein n=1 Tax=Synaphobranchus kaupii TaxID=118154 RepID=A0A9Q1E4D6_SYNKA|nr:hypothetical protein SKAU_G00429860 [Synaphobranchus kaupii]
MPSKADDSKAHCKFCSTDIRAHLKDMKDHNETKKHKMRCLPTVKAFTLAVREDRQGIVELQKQVEKLTQKMADMEDRARQNNVRLVGLPESLEGSDAAGYLKANLAKWIPSLAGRGIEIDRAHRIYNGREQNSGRPRTLIFRLLRWQDRTAILREARKAYPVKHHKSTLLFFSDYSAPTTTKRKGFNPAIKDARDMGLQPFLIYPATLKLDHGGKKLTFDCPQKAEDLIRSLKSSQQPHRPESYASAVRRCVYWFYFCKKNYSSKLDYS